MQATEFYSYLRPLLALQSKISAWEGDPPSELVRSLVSLNKPIFQELKGHPKFLQSVVPILAHLVTGNKVSAVHDVQLLVDKFPPQKSPRRESIHILDSPTRPGPSRAESSASHQPNGPAPGSSLGGISAPSLDLLTAVDAQRVHAELLSWGHERRDLDTQAKRLFLALFKSAHVKSMFPDQDFHQQWQTLAQMPMSQAFAAEVRKFISSSPPGDSSSVTVPVVAPPPDPQSILAELL